MPGSRVRIRWDRAHAWILPASEMLGDRRWSPTETAFVGGINLNPRTRWSTPDHLGRWQFMMRFWSCAGPLATDVHHNFVQRWNEASERAAEDGIWAHNGDDELPFPERPSKTRGNARVEIQRNVHAGLYRNSRPSPSAEAFEIAEGEATIREQYLAAIRSARRSIYIENQALSAVAIVDAIRDALVRGIQIVLARWPPRPSVGSERRDYGRKTKSSSTNSPHLSSSITSVLSVLPAMMRRGSARTFTFTLS